jgi:hypothetical protein
MAQRRLRSDLTDLSLSYINLCKIDLVYCLPFPLRTGLTDLELSDQRPRQ